MARQHIILDQPPFFLKLRTEKQDDKYRAVLIGDRATKVLLDWTEDKKAVDKAFDLEKALYDQVKAK